MRFIDETIIHVKAGDGGHGCIAFLREKFRPNGGPCGRWWKRWRCNFFVR